VCVCVCVCACVCVCVCACVVLRPFYIQCRVVDNSCCEVAV